MQGEQEEWVIPDDNRGVFWSLSPYFEETGSATTNELLFHSSWDWLMPVIVEIGDRTGYSLNTGYDYSYWNDFGENPLEKEWGGYANIENAWTACVEFIEWHNENRKQQ